MISFWFLAAIGSECFFSKMTIDGISIPLSARWAYPALICIALETPANFQPTLGARMWSTLEQKLLPLNRSKRLPAMADPGTSSLPFQARSRATSATNEGVMDCRAMMLLPVKLLRERYEPF